MAFIYAEQTPDERKALQRELNDYFGKNTTGGIDGLIGKKSQASIAKFAEANGLPEGASFDDILGKLKEVNAEREKALGDTKLGAASKEQIAMLQSKLSEAGIDVGGADGIRGPKTNRGIETALGGEIAADATLGDIIAKATDYAAVHPAEAVVAKKPEAKATPPISGGVEVNAKDSKAAMLCKGLTTNECAQKVGMHSGF